MKRLPAQTQLMLQRIAERIRRENCSTSWAIHASLVESDVTTVKRIAAENNLSFYITDERRIESANAVIPILAGFFHGMMAMEDYLR